MDPSRTICEVQNSFNLTDRKYTVKKYHEPTQTETRSPRTVRNRMIEKGRSYENINIEKSNITLPESIANPVTNISKVFDKSDIILANIDAVYNLTGQEDGYLAPQYIKDFDFASLDGNYLTYLQYRLPASRGFIPCDNNYKADETSANVRSSRTNYKSLDKRLLNSGCEKESIVDFVLANVPEGMDLVVSSSDNFKSNLLKALQICKVGGSFISRVDKYDLILFYITALSFGSFSLFKPISENLNQDYFYVVAQDYKGNSIDWVNLLKDDKELKVAIPADFLSYVFNFNISLNNLKEDLLENPVKYNVYKCKAIWNIF